MEQRLRLIQRGAVTRTEKRAADRVALRVPAQIVWKDAQGRTQLAAVTTSDVSEYGVRFEMKSSLTLPLYRLVHFQVDRAVRARADLPEMLKKQTVLAAVFRVGPTSQLTGTPTEYALRLLIEPKRAQDSRDSRWRTGRAGQSRTA